MPFRIDLHAADINAVFRVRDSLRQIGERRRPVVEEQPLAAVIQRPGPGHEVACHRLSARLDTRDALQQTFRNAVTGLGPTCLEKAYILEGCQRLAGLRHRLRMKRDRQYREKKEPMCKGRACVSKTNHARDEQKPCHGTQDNGQSVAFVSHHAAHGQASQYSHARDERLSQTRSTTSLTARDCMSN